MAKAARDRAVLLTGMMGSGKSSAGRALARRLGWRFVDTDELVEQARGLRIAEIFRQEGEASFREMERAVLNDLPDRRSVVALGGGAVVSAENRAILRVKGVLVWLEAKAETLAARIGEGRDRPLLAGTQGQDRVERLRRLEAQRADAFARADVRVQTEDRNIEQVCDAILEALGWEDAA